jgi:uncharacterized peroxidase-related enzyme
VAATKDEGWVAAVLADYTTAPIDAKLRATLGFLEKLTLAPTDVGPDDIAPLRAAGVSDRAVEEAIYVCALFNIVDRIADALGFVPSSKEGLKWASRFLLRLGYRGGSVPR